MRTIVDTPGVLYLGKQGEHLARELILLHAERSVRIAGGPGNGDAFRVERKR